MANLDEFNVPKTLSNMKIVNTRSLLNLSSPNFHDFGMFGSFVACLTFYYIYYAFICC